MIGFRLNSEGLRRVFIVVFFVWVEWRFFFFLYDGEIESSYIRLVLVYVEVSLEK